MTDGIVTFIGLKGGLIQEANPIMRWIYLVDPSLFLAVKCMLSIVLILFIYYDKVPTLQSIKSLGVFAFVLYTVAFFLHSIWIWDFWVS
ncbi:DUF5658 family protein [Rossellomorea aquimaris]